MATPHPIPAGADRSPLRELLVMAAPAVASMLSYTLMQFVDAWMVARLGPEELAAQGNGGIMAYVAIAIVIGLVGVINTYVAQHVGAGTPDRAAAYAWNGLWMCVVASALMLVYAGFMGHIFALMGHSEKITRLETIYARILLAGAFFTVAARALSNFFYGAQRPSVVLLATVAGNVVNLVANYALIFGYLGAPRLEVPGAAIGTLIGAGVEFGLLTAVFLSPRFDRVFRTRAAWRYSAWHMRRLWRIGWPGGLMHGNEMICWGVFMAALVGSFGAAHNAASWIALRYLTLSFMPVLGLSFAVTAVVGKQIGRGDFDGAARRAVLGVRLGMAYMGVCAVAFVLFREPMVALFIGPEVAPEQAAEMLRVGRQIMICAAVFQLFDALGVVLIGALRGAGDTIWPGVVTAALSWGVIIGVGWAFVVLAPGLGSLGPWIAAAAFIILLGVAMAWRFWSGKWRSIDLIGQEPPERAGPANAP